MSRFKVNVITQMKTSYRGFYCVLNSLESLSKYHRFFHSFKSRKLNFDYDVLHIVGGIKLMFKRHFFFFFFFSNEEFFVCSIDVGIFNDVESFLDKSHLRLYILNISKTI